MNTHQTSDASPAGNTLSVLWHVTVWVFVIVTIALAWFVATESPYKAGDAIGYNMGLVGGSMMLLLLVYSLRKRLGFMNKAWPVRHYFAFHMFLGVVGPILVIFHTTFKIGALNSRIALYSMLLGGGSGLVVRFGYRHIHKGLYGRQAGLAKAAELLNESAESVQSILSISPEIEKKLGDFRAYSVLKLKGVLARSWRFMTLRMRGQSCACSPQRSWHALEQAGREKTGRAMSSPPGRNWQVNGLTAMWKRYAAPPPMRPGFAFLRSGTWFMCLSSIY